MATSGSAPGRVCSRWLRPWLLPASWRSPPAPGRTALRSVRHCIAGSRHEPTGSPSQSRIDEHDQQQIYGVEDEHVEERLLQPLDGISFTGGPERDEYIGEQDRYQNYLLHWYSPTCR